MSINKLKVPVKKEGKGLKIHFKDHLPIQKDRKFKQKVLGQ